MSSSRQDFIDHSEGTAQLAGALAHEIKNPLSTIRLNMQLLEEDLEGMALPTKSSALKKVYIVKKECGRLEELLQDFLDYTKSDQIQLEPRDVNRQLRDLVDFYRPQAKASSIEMIEYYASDLPTVRLDPKSFRRAILNLLINAQQAMPDGGQLMLRTRKTGNDVAIDLIDTGCGMDDRTASNVFNAFYSTKEEGTGLGLSTVKRTVQAHGGRIHMQSELGRGTQFTLLFPSVPRLSGSNDESSQPEPKGCGQSSCETV